MFSTRVPGDRRPNRLALALAAVRSSGRELLDLTATNPTTAGFNYPPALLQPLASAEALTYSPHPFGLPDARSAVAREFARRGIRIASDRVVLTASTSEAYSLLFKLLCAPAGDAVMVPIPSYPLFDHLTELDGVATIPYPLEYHSRWALDTAALDRRWMPNVRAVLAVSPNNPTGSVLSPPERAVLDGCCAARDAALILDEVFADFSLDGSAAGSVEEASHALTFRLGGLSKSAGLPQVKLGWIGVEGPDALVTEALDRLELICDTYLSVSTPVQIATPDLLDAGETVRRQILERIKQNYETLRAIGGLYPSIEVLPAEAGWSAVLRVPSVRSEEDLVLELLEHDVLVHPGFFFDFPQEAFLVLSLLPAFPVFERGVRVLMERAHG